MAGPSCTVLHSKTIAAKSSVDELIRLIGCYRDAESFGVTDTRAVGGSYEGIERPFILYSEQRDSGEIGVIEASLGQELSGEVGLAAMCNGDEDHQILAEIAIWLSERLAGYIDLEGTKKFPENLPGRICLIPYETASGHQAEYAVIDSTALRAWLSCTEFRMVK
jgi:hypothetical protein